MQRPLGMLALVVSAVNRILGTSIQTLLPNMAVHGALNSFLSRWSESMAALDEQTNGKTSRAVTSSVQAVRLRVPVCLVSLVCFCKCTSNA